MKELSVVLEMLLSEAQEGFSGQKFIICTSLSKLLSQYCLEGIGQKFSCIQVQIYRHWYDTAQLYSYTCTLCGPGTDQSDDPDTMLKLQKVKEP